MRSRSKPTPGISAGGERRPVGACRPVSLVAFLLVPIAAVLLGPASVVAQTPGFLESGQSGLEYGGPIAVTVELDAISGSDTFVPYAVSGDALAPDDYALTPASPLVIPAGLLSADLVIEPAVDETLEGEETIVIQLEGQPQWWDPAFRYRVPISIDATTRTRTNHVVEVPVDFTAMLSALGDGSALNLDSLRVVEVDADQQVLDPAVPFQFDPDTGFDPLLQATGTLLFQLGGVTPAATVRDFHLYFDTAGGFAPAVVAPQVVLTDDVMDEGQASYEVVTTTGTYLYQKLGGGFSSMIDPDGNDWIDYHPTGGAEGNYRGIPNLTHTEGYFHPGLLTSVTTLLGTGPLRASFESASADETWRVRWDVFPDKARMRVLAAAADYWFMYEGAPGGSLETTTDFIVRSTGVQTSASTSWAGDIPSEEWLFVADPNVGRSLYLVNHTDDAEVDSYWQLTGDMTVLGLGRLGRGQPLDPQMAGTPRDFTIGFIDETTFTPAAALIRGATEDVGQTLGLPEDRELAPITTHTVILDDVVRVPSLGPVGGAVLVLGSLLVLHRGRRHFPG